VSKYGYTISKYLYYYWNNKQLCIYIPSGTTVDETIHPRITKDNTNLLTTAKVKVCGENLIPKKSANTEETVEGVSAIHFGDGSIYLTGTSRENGCTYELGSALLDNGVRYISNGNGLGIGCAIDYWVEGVVVGSDVGSPIEIIGSGKECRITLKLQGNETYKKVITPILSKQLTIKPISAEGTVEGVTSISPTTTLIPDTEGIVLEVEYNRDANKVIDELYALINGGPSSRISYIDLPSANWKGSGSPYSQVVTIDGVTENSKVDINPSVEQLAIFHTKDIAFVAENEDGVVTVYCIGQKPTSDYQMQITITEVDING
jgi:hypothetical protein